MAVKIDKFPESTKNAEITAENLLSDLLGVLRRNITFVTVMATYNVKMLSPMKKILCVTALLLCSVVSLYAQKGGQLIQFGLKAGITAPSFKLRNPDGMSTESKVGFQAGLMTRINLLSFHIQPELLYMFNQYQLTDSPSGTLSVNKVKVNTFEVPVLLGLRLLMFRIQAGPSFNIMVKNSTVNKKGSGLDLSFSRPSVSYMVGLGFDIMKVNIDLRYHGQFKNSRQYIADGTGYIETDKLKGSQWLFSVGYMF